MADYPTRLRWRLADRLAKASRGGRARLVRRYDIDSLDNRDPELIDWVCRHVSDRLTQYFDAEVRGVERIAPGPGLYVGNHNAGMLTPDTFIFGAAVYDRHGIDATPYGLGHEVAISLPLVHQIIVPLGAVRASHDNAHRLFQRGAKVLVYPGGDLEAMRPYRHRNRIVFGGRRGYVRLALREAVPIIPVVAAGAHSTFIVLDDLRWLARATRLDKLLRIRVLPVTLSAPWGITIGPVLAYLPYPSRILIEILDPIRFERAGPDASKDEAYVRQCADRVECAMQATLERLAAERETKSRR